MNKDKISHGTVHKVPRDMREVLLSKQALVSLWEDITPLARNEWICWVEDAKKQETRDRRISIMVDKMSAGKRRPCCWAGCSHR